MGSYIFLVMVWGIGSVLELRKLWQSKRVKEMVFYLLVSFIGLIIFGLYVFWNTMPSLYSLLSGITDF